MDLLHVPDHKIHIIRPGIERHAGNGGDPSGAARLLYVGSIFNRRHLPDLIRAFGLVARAHHDAELDIVGDDRTHPPEDIPGLIARQETGARIRWHRYVPDEELSDLYRSARAFAFLSEYEGLGLTPLEALSAGIPSVLLDTPIARESCGPAAMYVPKDNLMATAEALEQLLYDESARRRLLAAAPEVLSRYDWSRAARETLDVLEAAP
jgi:glycosyltransferase involved in cell wall biosynthesis